MNSPGRSLKPSLVIFLFGIMLFALIIVNGYVLGFFNLVVQPRVILFLVCAELIGLILWVWHLNLRIASDPVELTGFLIVVAGTWLHVTYPSWPTLLPPTYSGDAPNHLAYVNSIFNTDRVFGDYPAGPALIAAMLGHWMGTLPVFMLHPLGAFWLALTAGGIYGLACAILPDRREYKILALFAALALFIQWDFFAGILMGMHYFWTQVAGQMFIVAFVWLLQEYRESPSPLLPVGMALCLIGLYASFQLWLALPLALIGWVVLRQWRERGTWLTAIFVVGTLAIWWAIVLLTGGKYTSTLDRLRGFAPALAPSLAAFGGPFLVLPALGVLVGLRRHVRARAELVIAFLVFAALQSLALEGAHIWLDVGTYWVNKSFFVLAFPLALLSVLPLANVLNRLTPHVKPAILMPALSAGLIVLGMFRIASFDFPPGSIPPLVQSDVQVALWAKEHLDTTHIHYIGAKNIVAQWLGVGFWDEKYPDDLFDFASLGPKTIEEWRDDPAWGEYLLVSSNQHFKVDSSLRVLFQRDGSAILQKQAAGRDGNASPEGHFGDSLTLVEYALPQFSFHAGDAIPLTAQIETGHVPAHRVVWRVQLRDLQNNAITEARYDPFGGKYPLQRWPDGIVTTQPMTLPLPIETRPGLYDLELGLYEVTSGKPVPFKAGDGSTDDVIHLPRIKVALPPVTLHELAAAERMGARVGNGFELLGYRLKKESPVHPGDSVQVSLYWRSLASETQDYTVFVHLIDASGKLRAQQDSAPRSGTYPTSIWETDEVVPDSYRLTVPSDAAPGDYHIEIGMYRWPSLQRLAITVDSLAAGDHLLLPVTVHVVGK